MGQGRHRHRPDLQGRGRLKRTVVSALAFEQGDGESRRLLLGTVGTVALNVASVALNLAVVLLLTRLLGPDGFGAYASAYAWAVVLSVLAVLGLTPLVIRHVASYSSNGNWGLLRGLLRRTNQSVAIASAAVAASAALAGFLLYRQRPELLHPFWIGLPLVPLIALTSLRQAAMQGLGRVVLGRVPETLALPILLIALASSAALASGDGFGASWAIASHVVAALCAFALGAHLLRRMLPPDARSAPLSFETAAWRRSGISLVLLNVLMAGNAQAGTILLGAFEGAGDAGVFNVATRTTMFVSFLMLAATYPLMPVAARLHAAGRHAELQRVLTGTVRVVLVFAVPTALVLVVFGRLILGVFGTGFEDGETSIRILTAGEVVNVLTGFGGLVLVMTGHERELALCVGLGTALNVALTATLVPLAGLEGAAIGTAAGLAASNLAMALLAWKRLGIWSPIVSRPRRALA